MSDLVKSMTKTNWHTVIVLVPGLTFLLITAKIYVDMSDSKLHDVLSAKIQSMEKSQDAIDARIIVLSEQIVQTARDISRNCSDSRPLINDYKTVSDE